MRAIKDIRAGQELLWSYGPLAGCHTYEQRKERCSTLVCYTDTEYLYIYNITVTL